MKSQQMRFKMRYLKKINEIFWPGSGSTTGNKDNIEKNFDKISEILSKECSQFLNLLKEKNIKGIYRGSTLHWTDLYQKDIEGFYKLKPFENRLSRDTNSQISKIFDDEFEKAFGVRLRSKGVFATKEISIARDYGKFKREAFLFIPTNGFRYFWNPNIEDLFTEIRDKWWYQKDQFYWDQSAWNEINRICHGYREGGIEENKWQELTFICDEYYMLDLDYYDKFIDYLF
jgi:hypothetical protein